MGHRTVKRVPLGFDHPQGEVWPGFLPPRPARARPATTASPAPPLPANGSTALFAC